MNQKPQTLPDFLYWACTAHNSKVAYKYRPRFRAIVWTYNDLLTHSIKFANELNSRGVNTGDCVIIIGHNSPYWAASFFGTQIQGAIAVPLPPESSEEFLKKIVNQTNAKLILKSKYLSFDVENIPQVNIEDVEKPAENLTFNAMRLNKDDIAQIVYTSGSTGDPKGVILTHENILSNVWGALDAIKLTRNAKLASILPLFHMLEQTGGMLVPLAVGGQVSHAASLNPNHLKWIFEDDGINRMLVVPEFLRLMRQRIIDQAKKDGSYEKLNALLKICGKIPSMKFRKIVFRKIHSQFKWNMHSFISGGAPLDKEVGDFWERIGIYIIQGYGLTETSPVLTINRYNCRKTDSVGKPIQGVLVKLSATEEILAKGPNIFKGYWKDEEKTKKSFTEDGWFKTGDIGFFDRDGHLRIKGREKFMIVLPSGEKVHPEDLEDKLRDEPEVKDCAVIGIQTGPNVEAHAALVLKDGVQISHKNVIERVNNNLMPYQRIKKSYVWPDRDFPRTPTRKVRKGEVESWIKSQVLGKHEETPANAYLSVTGRIIGQVLEVSDQEISDNKRLAADLKMDSLKRIELVARIENELNVSVDEANIGPNTTILDIKNMISSGQQSSLKYPFDKNIFSKFTVFLRKITFALLLKPIALYSAPVKVYGKENLKNLNSPALYFANHLTSVDAFLIYAILPSKLRPRLSIAGAADTVFEAKTQWLKFWTVFLKFLIPVFPFVRYGGQTKSSFIYIGRAIDRNFSVLLFPEGKISRTAKLLPFKEGAGLLATEMGTPVVLIKLAGTENVMPPDPEGTDPRWHWPKRSNTSVIFSKPIKIDPDMDYREVTKVLEKKMTELSSKNWANSN